MISSSLTVPRVWKSLLVVSAIAGAVWIFATRVSGKMPDLDVYLRAGARAAAAEPLYRAEDAHYQFKYLPAFALLMAPFDALSVGTSRAIWFGASAALLGVLLVLSARLVQSSTDRDRPLMASPLLVVVAVAVLGKFYARELVLGQANLACAVTIVAALIALRHGRETAAGILVALSIVLKPYGVIFVPWMLARRQARSLVPLALGLSIALAIPSVVYGVAGNMDLHRSWWQTVLATTAPNLLNPDNVSWLAMLTRWFDGAPGPWPLTLLTIWVVCLTGAAAWVWTSRKAVHFPEGLEGAMLLLVMPFLSPQGWDYVLLVATPAVMYAAAFAHRLPAGLRWVTMIALAVSGLTIYDLMGRQAYHAFMNASGITLCFIVVLAALVTLRLRRVV